MTAAREDKPKKPTLEGVFIKAEKKPGAPKALASSVLTVKLVRRHFTRLGQAAVKVSKVHVKDLEKAIREDMKHLASQEKPVDLAIALSDQGMTVLRAETALDLLDNPGKPNKKLAALLELH
ncbi:hypothetical protein FQZ97_336450 [compost metagenome]